MRMLDPHVLEWNRNRGHWRQGPLPLSHTGPLEQRGQRVERSRRLGTRMEAIGLPVDDEWPVAKDLRGGHRGTPESVPLQPPTFL